MKKTLAIILTVMLVFTAFVTTVSAAQSPEQVTGIITGATGTDANGKQVRLIIRPASGDISYFELAAGDDKIADYKVLVLEGDGDPALPIEVMLDANGIKATDDGYILFKDSNGKIVKLDAVMSNGKIKVTFPSLGEFALVLLEDGKEPPKSDQTSDNFTAIAFTLLIASAAVTLVSVKKIRNAA